jgi:hypothetical protein
MIQGVFVFKEHTMKINYAGYNYISNYLHVNTVLKN